MADTAKLGITKPSVGASDGTWGTTLNTALDTIDLALFSHHYAENSAGHNGLNFAYKAGVVRDDNAVNATVAGTVALTGTATNYIEVLPSTGLVSANAVGFTAGSIPLFTVVTAAGAIGAVTDKRSFLPSTSVTPPAHDLGGASHTAGTLADLNTKISDATLTDMHISINEQVDSYTLVIGDDGKLIDMNKSTACTLTVPKNASVAFAIGAQILVRQKGAGQVTIAPVDIDVTLNSASSALKAVAQYSMVGLIKIAENTWAVFGDLEA